MVSFRGISGIRGAGWIFSENEIEHIIQQMIDVFAIAWYENTKESMAPRQENALRVLSFHYSGYLNQSRHTIAGQELKPSTFGALTGSFEAAFDGDPESLRFIYKFISARVDSGRNVYIVNRGVVLLTEDWAGLDEWGLGGIGYSRDLYPISKCVSLAGDSLAW